jgi:hypothetical protein
MSLNGLPSAEGDLAFILTGDLTQSRSGRQAGDSRGLAGGIDRWIRFQVEGVLV